MGEPARRRGYGIEIEFHDGIDCPGFNAGGATEPATAVRLGEVGAPWDHAVLTRELEWAGETVFRVWQRTPGEGGHLLEMPAHGRFLIAADGREVVCEPAGEEWTVGLRTQALPIAATARGVEPLHAAAVVLGGRALALSGPVGAGKSTLTAELVRQGATLLSDDVVGVRTRDGALAAEPAERWLHLRPPHDHAGGDRLVPDGERDGRRRFRAPLSPEPAPLGALYLLAPGPVTAVEPASASGVGLLGTTYNLSVRTPERLTRQLALCERIASEVPVRAVTVDRATEPAALAEAIAADLRALP